MNDQLTTAERTSAARLIPLAVWTLAWIFTLALARFGPEFLWGGQPLATWIVVAFNIAAGIGWIAAHARYLRGVDDLQRKILFDAIASALGVGLVAGFAYSAAQANDLIDLGSDIGVFSVFLGVVYMVTVAVGTIRYR